MSKSITSDNIPLGQFPVIRTQTLSDLEEFVTHNLHAKICSFSRQGSLDLIANGYTLPNSAAWFCSYGKPIKLSFADGDYLRLQFHHRGEGSTKIGQKEYLVTKNQAVISYAAADINFGVDYQQKLLRVNTSSLMKKLAALSGAPAIRPIQFEPAFDPTSERASILKDHYDYYIKCINSGIDQTSKMILLEMEQLLLTSLLVCCKHNYSSLLERQSSAAAPRQVTLVEDYIEANWSSPLLIEEIAAITDCSARSIFRAFRQARGYSPMSFAKQVRLRHARQMLIQGDKVTISELAYMCGFTDHGRFSRAYAQAFGELPSETLRQKYSGA